MNKVILIGRLTKEVKFETTTNNVGYARFSLAVPRKFKNADGENECDFINVLAWRGLAETCSKYLKKGDKCCIVGNIQTRSYDAQDGTKKYATEVVAEELEFLETKKKEESKLTPIEDDDLPF